jgi:hypothetical protein
VVDHTKSTCAEPRKTTMLKQKTYKLGRHIINQRLNVKVSLKAEEDIEAADNFFNDTIQWAGWNATP